MKIISKKHPQTNTIKMIVLGAVLMLFVSFKTAKNDDPIYLDPVNHKYFGAHFYSPSKYFLDYKFDTFSANLIVIWLMTIFLTITLYFDVLRKILEFNTSKR